MQRQTVKKDDCHRPSRRSVLKAAAVAAAGWLGQRLWGQSRPSSRPASAPASRPALRPVPTPWWLREDRGRARVVDVRSAAALTDSLPDPVTVEELLDQGILYLTEAETLPEAWRAALGNARNVVIKFNSVGAQALATNDALARAIVARLRLAGYPREAITLVEAPHYLYDQLGVRRPVSGWGKSISVSGQVQPLARYFLEADAVINVPLLKTHQIAGMSCCMKNLSHAIIRHPARCHANGCSPYVGQVIGHPEVSRRIKLHVVNALRVVFNRGPDATPEDIGDYGGLLLGFDPLAIDLVGRSILGMERRQRNMSAWFAVPSMDTAAEMGVGRWRPAEIERIALELAG